MSRPIDPFSQPAAQADSDHPSRDASRGPASSTGWLIVLGIVAVAAVIFAVRRGAQQSPSDAVGKPAPPIDVIPLTGDAPPIPFSGPAEPAAEAASFDGITLLHFWGTWCPPCRMEYPELIEMVHAFSSEPDFRFISVSCEAGVGESSFEMLQQETEEYYESIGVDVPTYCDPAGRTRRATAAILDNPGLYYPSTLLIDRQGKIVQVWEGFTPSGVEQMRKAIAAKL